MTTKNNKLGKYTLADQLGSGGFGTVYRATDSIGRTVAVKVLKPGWSDDPSAIERFRREAQAAGALFHNRIATIIDFDEFEGRFFLVMRYIDGIPLDRLIKEKGSLGWQETMHILAEAAEGLDYAHQHGFIHRDIKPANILVSEKEGAVLTDFGLVKAAETSGLSTSGVMLGTPNYIPPEIWEGKPATPASDLYSLACVACEMLTGNILFAGKSPPEVMTRHMSAAPQFPGQWPEGVPSGVSQVLLQALDKNPEKRPASAHAFVSSLMEKGEEQHQEIEKQARMLLLEAEALLEKGDVEQAEQKLSRAENMAPDLPAIAGRRARLAEALLQQAETLIQAGEVQPAEESLSRAENLAPNLPTIPQVQEKLAGAKRLAGLYEEASHLLQAAREKAGSVLAANPAHPDPKRIFPSLGLREPFRIPAVPHPPVEIPSSWETFKNRWQEESIPYVLIFTALLIGSLGFVYFLFQPVFWHVFAACTLVSGLGLVSGSGLIGRKNWARILGLVFGGAADILGIWMLVDKINPALLGALNFDFYYDPLSLGRLGILFIDLDILFLCLVVILSLYALYLLSGPRMAAFTNGKAIRPSGILGVAVTQASTIVGLLPAYFLLSRKRAARGWAMGYSVILAIFFLAVGVRTEMDLLTYRPATYYQSWGVYVLWVAFESLFFVSLCILAIRTLRKPEVRAYFDRKEP
jgi:serine/threonine protein kinase